MRISRLYIKIFLAFLGVLIVTGGALFSVNVLMTLWRGEAVEP